MSVSGKVLPARFSWLSIDKMWMVKYYHDKRWLLTAFLNWRWTFSKKCQNSRCRAPVNAYVYAILRNKVSILIPLFSFSEGFCLFVCLFVCLFLLLFLFLFCFVLFLFFICFCFCFCLFVCLFFSQNKKLITKVTQHSVGTCIKKTLQNCWCFLSQDIFNLVLPF